MNIWSKMLKIDKTKHKKILKISLPAAFNSLLDMLQVITDLIMGGLFRLLLWLLWGLGCNL